MGAGIVQKQYTLKKYNQSNSTHKPKKERTHRTIYNEKITQTNISIGAKTIDVKTPHAVRQSRKTTRITHDDMVKNVKWTHQTNGKKATRKDINRTTKIDMI